MAGPPDNVEAKELWLKLSEAPAPSEIVDFPRRGADGKPIRQIRIQVLSMAAHDEARMLAHQRLAKQGIKPEDTNQSVLLQEVLGDAVAREILAMSCVTVKPIHGDDEDTVKPTYGRLFVDGESLRQLLTPDEVTVLFNSYLLVQEKWGPLETTVNGDEELNAWVERLAEGGSLVPLAATSSVSLAGLCLSLAQRVSTLSELLRAQWQSLPPGLASSLDGLLTGTGSSGEPPDDSTPTPSTTPPSDSSIPVNAEQAMALARQLGHKPLA